VDLKVGTDQATEAEIAAVDTVVGALGPAVVVQSDRVVVGGFHRSAERRHLLLPGLHALQQANGWISPGGMQHLCTELGVPPAEAYGVATFYDMLATEVAPDVVVRRCDDIGCRTQGFDKIDTMLGAAGLGGEHVEDSPCLGLCDHGGAAVVQRKGAPVEGYRVVAGASEPVIESHLASGARLLARVGQVDPSSLDSYLAERGYQALNAAIEQGPDAVIASISDAGLRGRGGAAFPAGVKWRGMADQKQSRKHVVANADESEPGTFKDRVLMEHDPFALVESLTIAGFATGATDGWIYIRGEYPLAIERVRNAVAEARRGGLLGEDILGSGWDFDIEIRVGAGAYICGEETALFNSIEGFRGEPRQKPPFPTTHGLFNEPTVINNVETLFNVLDIVNYGVDHFRSIGSEASAGPRLFCLSGAVARPGVYEHPMGVTLRQVLAAAGGVAHEAQLKTILLGGAAGSFVNDSVLDLPLTFEDTRSAGVSLGSGVVMLFDETANMVDIVGRITKFFAHESCGQCVPCRIGTQRQAEMVGADQPIDRDLFDDLAAVMGDASICGLGHTAASALRSALDLELLS